MSGDSHGSLKWALVFSEGSFGDVVGPQFYSDTVDRKESLEGIQISVPDAKTETEIHVLPDFRSRAGALHPYRNDSIRGGAARAAFSSCTPHVLRSRVLPGCSVCSDS